MAKKLNVAMLDKVEDVMTSFPKRHNQNSWRIKLTGKNANLNGAPARECGTSMCVAGWIAELDRGRWAYPPESVHSYLLYARQDEVADGVTHEWVTGRNGEPLVPAAVRAQRVLGITDSEASKLFLYTADKRGVKKFFRDLKQRYGVV